jgi:hypothetical protein
VAPRSTIRLNGPTPRSLDVAGLTGGSPNAENRSAISSPASSVLDMRRLPQCEQKPRTRRVSVQNGQKFFVSFFQKRKRFFLKKEAKTFIRFDASGPNPIGSALDSGRFA